MRNQAWRWAGAVQLQLSMARRGLPPLPPRDHPPLFALNTTFRFSSGLSISSASFVKGRKYPASAEKCIEKHPFFSSGSRFGGLSFVKDRHIRPLDENLKGYSHLFSTAPRKPRVLTKIRLEIEGPDENPDDGMPGPSPPPGSGRSPAGRALSIADRTGLEEGPAVSEARAGCSGRDP